MQAIVQNQDIDIEIKLKNNRKYTWRKKSTAKFLYNISGNCKKFYRKFWESDKDYYTKRGNGKIFYRKFYKKKILETAKS